MEFISRVIIRNIRLRGQVDTCSYTKKMPHVCCCVPGCSNRSDRDTNRTYHCLPLKNHQLLRVWIHKIGRSNLPLKSNTRICSDHFAKSRGRKLRVDEYPTLGLPKLPTRKTSPQKRKAPVSRCDERTNERR